MRKQRVKTRQQISPLLRYPDWMRRRLIAICGACGLGMSGAETLCTKMPLGIARLDRGDGERGFCAENFTKD